VSKAEESESFASVADQMIELLAAGSNEACLRRSVAVLRTDLDNAIGLLVMGQALAGLAQNALAISALKLGLQEATRQSLPLAVAACSWLSNLGVDVGSQRAELARLYAKGSSALRKDGATPPALEKPKRESQLVDPKETGEALIALVDRTIEQARAAIEGQIAAPSELVPQQLFSSLSERALCRLLEIFSAEAVPSQTRLLKQGTTGDEALILARGEIEVERAVSGSSPVILARLGTGTLVGEMALLARAPRTASVITCRPSIVLRAQKSKLDELATVEPQIAAEFSQQCHRRMIKNLLATSPMLKAVDPTERNHLIEHFKIRSFEAGEKLIAQGQPASGIHLIASGRVRVVIREKSENLELTQLGPGDSIGEVALVLRRNANPDVIAEFPTITLFMGAATLTTFITEQPKLLAQLYALAVMRDEETVRIAKEEAKTIDDFILV
jgi:cAMP-dependent protein kinase regulator